MAIQMRGARLKEHLVGVAAELFYIEGVHRVGVDRVADAAGVTKRTLYHHFRSKDDLVAAALRASPIVLFPKEGEPLARIRGAFSALSQYLRDNNFRGCPYIIFTAELTERHHPARQLIERRIEKRRKWFEARLLEAGFPDARARAEELDIVFDGALAASVKRVSLDPVRAAIALASRVLERS